MLLFELLAEQKISEAVSRGELDDLPGSGKPLDLDDDALVPEEMRLVCRILRNAGVSLAGASSKSADIAGADKVALIRAHIERLRMAAEYRRGRRRARP
jgi:hypothetical protein